MSFNPTHPIDDWSTFQEAGLLRSYHWPLQIFFFACYTLFFFAGGWALWEFLSPSLYWFIALLVWMGLVLPPFVFYPCWMWAAWQYRRGNILPFRQLTISVVEHAVSIGMFISVPAGFYSIIGMMIGLFGQFLSTFGWSLALLLASILLGPLQSFYLRVLADLREAIISPKNYNQLH